MKDVGDLAALLARGKPVLRIHPIVIADWQPPSPDPKVQSSRVRSAN